MKNFSDPKLTEISRQLRDVAFEPDSILEHAAEALTVMRGVRMFPENKKNPGAPREYAVVLYVAQKERIIGKTKWRAAACRFADMAKLRFYKFRQRHALPPTDDQLNFSVAQATTDLQFQHDAVAILDDVEAHFREKGWWKDTVEKETRQRDTKSERWTIAKALREVQSEVEVLKEQVAGLLTLAQAFKQPAPQCPIDAMVQHSKEFFKEAQVGVDPLQDLLP